MLHFKIFQNKVFIDVIDIISYNQHQYKTIICINLILGGQSADKFILILNDVIIAL